MKIRKLKAVIGLGFGDEGKGKVVSSLCRKTPEPNMVVRFCGGHQAGHQVIDRGIQHVFSNFGSGTLQGIPTYWTRFCTVDPVGILNELEVLAGKGVFPKLYLDQNAPITTPLEKQRNRDMDDLFNHGSVGVGVGATWQREQDHHSLTAHDLMFSWVLEQKLKLMADHYYRDLKSIMPKNWLTDFLADCAKLAQSSFVSIAEESLLEGRHLIFEGSQGLLLDQDIGFFPHVTRSNTGLTNVLEMGYLKPEVWLVTRAYQTRHGNGPMSNAKVMHKIANPHEHNRSDSFQGEFRTSILDLDLLKYGLEKELARCGLVDRRDCVLVVTCLDCLDKREFTAYNEYYRFRTEEEFLKAIGFFLQISKIVPSHTPETEEW